MQTVPIENDPVPENNSSPSLAVAQKPLAQQKANSEAIWNSFFGLIVSIIGGSYIGLSSKSMRESWIYCFILFLLSFICFILTITSKLYSRRKAISSFIFYFIIAGLTSPIASYLGIQLV